ncbi:MAG: thiamine-phosphate kinase [Candidatus Aminicenantes bacterium]|nr:thiamine-phosphate kinase [Candidatus Aminicenantes bacterium]
MKLKDIGEFGFIDRVKPLCQVTKKGIIKAIGDDCAVYKGGGEDRAVLFTTDMLVENVHFLLDRITPFELGYKTLAVNLSDIAAMGGKPLNAFLSIAVPERITVKFLDELYAGIMSLGRRYHVNVLGGDTTGSKNDLVLNIALTGEAEESSLLYRGGAQAGDKIYVNGYLGESAAGLEVLIKDVDLDETVKRYLVKTHLLPEVYIAEGAFLAETGDVTSCIDVSDGISSDLGHICRESGCGALLYEKDLPVSDELKVFAETTKKKPLDIILSGGEDYKLLFTVRNNKSDALENIFKNKFGRPLFCLGEIMTGKDIFLRNRGGEEQLIKPSGWDHF